MAEALSGLTGSYYRKSGGAEDVEDTYRTYSLPLRPQSEKNVEDVLKKENWFFDLVFDNVTLQPVLQNKKIIRRILSQEKKETLKGQRHEIF